MTRKKKPLSKSLNELILENLKPVKVDPQPYYDVLVKKADECRKCSGMRFDRTYLNNNNGPVPADIMFIGESCAAGEIKTIVAPFVDSASGRNFDHYLEVANLKRSEVFITNTVLHSPIKENGQLRPPSEEDIINCSKYLSAQIALVKPRIVVTLGATALFGISKLCDHNLRVMRDVGQVFNWWGRKLIPLFHPSPNTLTNRSKSQQEEDYKVIKEVLSELPDREEIYDFRA